PIFAAEAMERLMPEGLFAFAAVMHLLLALYTLYRMSRRQSPVTAAREVFQPMPVMKTATPASATLDPRAGVEMAVAEPAAQPETPADKAEDDVEVVEAAPPVVPEMPPTPPEPTTRS